MPTTPTFPIQCPNDSCVRRGLISKTVRGDTETAYAPTHDPKNWRHWRYCTACQSNMMFQCPDCKGWHGVRYLSTKPYICPKAVNAAKEKLSSTFFPFVWVALSTLGLWFLAVIMKGLFDVPAGWDYWQFLAISSFFEILIVFLLLFLSNIIDKKRKAAFAKKFPDEWDIIQRSQN